MRDQGHWPKSCCLSPKRFGLAHDYFEPIGFWSLVVCLLNHCIIIFLNKIGENCLPVKRKQFWDLYVPYWIYTNFSIHYWISTIFIYHSCHGNKEINLIKVLVLIKNRCNGRIWCSAILSTRPLHREEDTVSQI